MSVIVKTIISQETFSVGLGTNLCYVEDASNSMTVQGDGTSKTLQGWMDYIVATFLASYPTSTVTNNITDYEYSSFDNVNEIESKHSGFSDASGFPLNTAVNPTVGPGRAFGTLWGTYRLVISGSENAVNKYKSILTDLNYDAVDFSNDTYHFKAKAPVSNYGSDQDLKKYAGTSDWVGEEHIAEIKDFMNNSSGTAIEVRIYNVDRPADTDEFYFDLKPYMGYEQDREMANLRLGKFSFGIIEKV